MCSIKSGSNRKIYAILIAVLAVSFFTVASFSQTISNSNPIPTNTGPSYNSCSLFGGSGYTDYNNWVSINVIVLIISLLVVAIVFMFSRFLSTKESQKFSQAVKVLCRHYRCCNPRNTAHIYKYCMFYNKLNCELSEH